ncbi:ATP-binding protein [Streptomyces sp. FXJ1.4098]|nr:ATP-binding protein [Streptomyces sp. FXJ1.4098]
MLTYRAQDLVETLVKQYGDDAYPGLADDLLQVDHLLEQQVHRSQITALAVGAVFSLTRNDTYLIDLVMSAIGRVPEFRRRIGEPAVHLNRRIGVAARAAEPVASITAELLTNAVHHSHGTLPVSVAVHETDTGAAVVIEDAGVGLNADQLEQAARLLGGEIPVRLVGLGDPPHTGWAAIGRIVRQYGIQVGLRTSRFGGVEATVHVPGRCWWRCPPAPSRR